MNADLKDAFSRIKPICDVLMVRPSSQSIGAFVDRILDLKKEVVQELQQYLLFPLITHLKSSITHDKPELQRMLVDAMALVLGKIMVNSFEMCMKMEMGLLQIVFEHTRPGMNISEELKLSVMKCLTVLLLNIEPKYREAMLKAHVPLLGKAVYVSVHIAKMEKLRILRLAAIDCVTAHTATHPQLTNDYHIASPTLENSVVEMLSLILPGVLGALQDVATSCDNPGHLLVVQAIDAMHRILCLAMNNKFLKSNTELTAADFANMVKQKQHREHKNCTIGGLNAKSIIYQSTSDAEIIYVCFSETLDPKNLQMRSPEWFTVAGEKLLLVTKSLISLRIHEHFKVRKELAIYCSRLLFECNISLQSSVPLALDALICLSKDEYPEVSEYCTNAINTYFTNISDHSKSEALDVLCDNFFVTLTSLPRIMNNIDSNRKLSTLNLVHGYIDVLSNTSRPKKLTCALSVLENVQCVCTALAHTAAANPGLTLLTQHAIRDMNSAPPTNSPWCKLRHLDDEACERRFQDICRLLGEAECADLVLDRLLELFHQTRDAELVYIMNWMCTAPNSSENLIRRILNTYIEEDVWYLPLDVCNVERPLSDDDTLDVNVYDPRSWHVDNVPDLYEGAVETRYTDISYAKPRVRALASRSETTLSEAQRNMLLSCLLTEGIGVMAARLNEKYQPYLLKTLCLVLERVGSKYEMLHLSGLKSIHAIARACGHKSVAELVKCNADYFTNQVTVRLKKAWNCQSALQILSVVMEYSDSNILNYLYGIVQDVLVQSCDKYYERDLHAYLQVFVTFLECIRKWYMIAQRAPASEEDELLDLLVDIRDFLDNDEEAERLLSNAEFEKGNGKSVEELYRADVERREKEEEELNYDDTVTKEKPPLPQYVTVTATIMKRCLNYIVTSQRDNCILSLQILNTGFPILRGYDDELLPLVHQTWAPLVNKFEADHGVMRRAFDLLVTMAELSKDFIRSRAVKEVLPHIYKFLQTSSTESYLKDVGSCYRTSQSYSLQVTILAGLARLVTHLQLDDDDLEAAMSSVDPYLSNKQPKPLQMSAVDFFKRILDYEYGSAWFHLRQFCKNQQIFLAPVLDQMPLEHILGTPYYPADPDCQINVALIFNLIVT